MRGDKLIWRGPRTGLNTLDTQLNTAHRNPSWTTWTTWTPQRRASLRTWAAHDGEWSIPTFLYCLMTGTLQLNLLKLSSLLTPHMTLWGAKPWHWTKWCIGMNVVYAMPYCLPLTSSISISWKFTIPFLPLRHRGICQCIGASSNLAPRAFKLFRSDGSTW